MRALVLGTGFAGQSHTEALRHCGVEVVGMVGRTPKVLESVAAELKIPYTSMNWAAALAELRPDLVAIGTPGGAHTEPILQAVERGCHVYCDKPLAATAADARLIHERSELAGVKTAYAASFCYQPSALHARRLVAEGAIGELLECECVSHYDLNPLIPFGWSHRLEAGGGRLNNNFTHKLAIVLRVCGGELLEAAGECRNDLERVPIGLPSHDFRTREEGAPTAEEAERGEWAEVDSDWSYTVLTRIGSPQGRIVSALFRHGGLQPRFADDYVAFYGKEGALYVQGAYAQGGLYIKRRGRDDQWQPVPTPRDITASLPAIESDSQRNWTALARDFVADIRGEEHGPYLTFRDGWLFQEVIDAVRRGSGWSRLPAAPSRAN